MWPFRKKPEPEEEAYVEYGYQHIRVPVFRDAEQRPWCVICSTPIRLDVPTYRQIIWLKRRADDSTGEHTK